MALDREIDAVLTRRNRMTGRAIQQAGQLIRIAQQRQNLVNQNLARFEASGVGLDGEVNVEMLVPLLVALGENIIELYQAMRSYGIEVEPLLSIIREQYATDNRSHLNVTESIKAQYQIRGYTYKK